MRRASIISAEEREYNKYKYPKEYKPQIIKCEFFDLDKDINYRTKI